MAKVRREAHACTGRGFSKTDPAVFGDNSSGGFMSRLHSFAVRPNAHGTSFDINSSTFATSLFTKAAHGLVTGQSIVLTGTGTIDLASFKLTTSLTFPLSRTSFTEYFVIKLTNDTFQLAISHYNAMKTVPVPITFASDITGTITVTPLGGGANWYLHDDFSRMEAVDFATTAVNTTAETITLTGNAFSHMHKVTFSSTGAVPAGLVAGTAYWLIYVSAGVFKVASTESNAFAGTAINLTSQGTGTHTITTAEHFIVITDTLSPVVNDYNTSPAGCAPKFLKLGYLNSEGEYTRIQGYMWWDSSTHKGETVWAGTRIQAYDAAVFNYQLIAGDEFFFSSVYRGDTWNSHYVDTFTGFSSKLEAITKVGVLQGALTAGSSVVCQLAAGEAANFTVNKFYYIYDFVGHGWINYVKVTARDTGADTITIDSCTFNFPAGAVISPYAHRYYTYGSGIGQSNMNSNDNGQVRTGATIPYLSTKTTLNCFNSASTIIRMAASFLDGSNQYTSLGKPDDDGYYDCIKLVIGDGDPSVSVADDAEFNRIYGKTNNVLRTARGSMGQMTNYRTLLGVDYLYFHPAPTTYVDMIRYSESAS